MYTSPNLSCSVGDVMEFGRSSNYPLQGQCSKDIIGFQAFLLGIPKSNKSVSNHKMSPNSSAATSSSFVQFLLCIPFSNWKNPFGSNPLRFDISTRPNAERLSLRPWRQGPGPGIPTHRGKPEYGDRYG